MVVLPVTEESDIVKAPLPQRRGPRPRTTPTNPHTQLDQQPADDEALWLEDPSSSPPDAFMIGAEFAHLHPGADRSVHLMLPPELAPIAIDAGWAEQHPVAARGLIPHNAVMVYAPRDDAEREVVAALVRASHAYASGQWAGMEGVPA